jgi:hypothetical protein
MGGVEKHRSILSDLYRVVCTASRRGVAAVELPENGDCCSFHSVSDILESPNQFSSQHGRHRGGESDSSLRIQICAANTNQDSRQMKRQRIGVLVAGRDTPVLNSMIYGSVEEANRREIEVVGLVRGYASLVDDKVPAVSLISPHGHDFGD